MGQKVNPISFRSTQKLVSQNSNWFTSINDSNYQILLHQDFEIKDFLNNFFDFKNIYVDNILLNRYNNDLDIQVRVIIPSNKSLSLKEKILLITLIKKNLILNKHINVRLTMQNLSTGKSLRLQNKIFRKRKFRLFRYRRMEDFEEILKLMTIIFTFKSSEALLKYVTIRLQNSLKRKQFRDVLFLKNILKEFFLYYNRIKRIDGLKLMIKGRLNGSKRKKKKVLNYGQTPLQTLNIGVNYSFSDFINQDGMFGTKIWMFKKPQKQIKQ